jgi:hypothetical protein
MRQGPLDKVKQSEHGFIKAHPIYKNQGPESCDSY